MSVLVCACHHNNRCSYNELIKLRVMYTIWHRCWRRKILINLMNQSFIVKFSLSILCSWISTCTCNIYGSRQSAYWSWITSQGSDEALMSLPIKILKLRVYFNDIYREHSDKWQWNMAIHVWQLCTANLTAKVHDTTDFQYQAFHSLDKRDNHVATTVEVGEMSSQSTWHSLANQQQVHVHSNRNIYY